MKIMPKLFNSLDTYLIFFHLYCIGQPYLIESEMILLSLYPQFNIHGYIPHMCIFYMSFLLCFFDRISNTRTFDSFSLSFYLPFRMKTRKSLIMIRIELFFFHLSNQNLNIMYKWIHYTYTYLILMDKNVVIYITLLCNLILIINYFIK